jgi:hypothetical protein
VDNLGERKPGIEGNTDQASLVTGKIGLHQLVAIRGKKGDPISFLQTQSQKGVGQTVDPFVQLAKGKPMSLVNDGDSIRKP